MSETAETAETALIVIDVQESFRHRLFFRTDGLAAYVERQQPLIDGAVALRLPIVQVFHLADQGPFSDAGDPSCDDCWPSARPIGPAHIETPSA
ncbi:hypothetical protein [Methylobacterium gregans]|uniref:Isochorismatase hydrolase n=1 Tax=Methylobacterium gregans TaxID=374424 RepID=A0AA37HPD5_9HYPH|nr:hypothetical protein [Methylobacterium gregans]MDQ0519511.1 nicotinamidase-related amidase [Methylobacterium gregans]GJD79285.1 hypothetical protein NBEOAGPD_2509 [Methylobacterium gregans]GLS52848.1 hypothetical protein GCM10007886_10310 [Methylobacterium gregans]